VTYPDDDSYEYFLRDEMFSAEPDLRDDPEFMRLLDDLFDYDLLSNFDHGADDVWWQLHDYLMEEWHLELDDYFDWGQWKDEYSTAG
jgi:hypothetical protein